MKGGQFLFPALLKTIVLPPIIGAIIISLSPPTNIFVRATICLAAFPLLFALRSYISSIRSIRRARISGARDIPRVKGRWPLNLDVLRDWARSGSEEEVGRMMVLLARAYGRTYNTRVLGEDQIISTDPAVLKHVLIDDFDNFVKGAKFKDRAEAFLGDGIFNSDGERWKFHRALMRPFFHPTHISPSLFSPHIERFLASLPATGEAFDMQSRLGQLALEMAVMWVCGEDMSVLDDGDSVEWKTAKEGLGKAMTDAQRAVGKRVKIGTVWPLFELSHDPLAEPMRIIRSFFSPIVARALERRDERKNLASGSEDLKFIDRLVEATEDRQLVEDQLINVLLASKDTLSSCLTFCVYCLALYPACAQKMREEVRMVLDNEEAITKDAIRELRYTRAFINEVLRLFPPVPLNIRRTLRPSLLPISDGQSPLYMPANTSIILATVLMQRDPSVWGGDAQDFVPDRWLGDGLGKSEREGFMSWNVGPRMCLGQPFALTVVHTFLILLSRHLDRVAIDGQECDLQLASDAQPAGTAMPEMWKTAAGSDGRARDGREKVWVVADVVLAVKGGLWVRLGHEP